jgi:hypothetical protein
VVNVAAELKRLETAAVNATAANADAVLSAVDRLYPELDTPDEQAQAHYVRFRALEKKDDAVAACRSIREAVKIVVDADSKQKYERYADGC